jgi:hypothetical protein
VSGDEKKKLLGTDHLLKHFSTAPDTTPIPRNNFRTLYLLNQDYRRWSSSYYFKDARKFLTLLSKLNSGVIEDAVRIVDLKIE